MIGIQITFGLLSLVFFSIGLTLFGYRNDLETLRMFFPLMRQYREQRRAPVFNTKGEVMAISLIFLMLGFGAYFVMFRL